MKRIAIIILAGVTAMTLMACGQKDVEDTVTTLAPTQPTASAQPNTPNEPNEPDQPATPAIPAVPAQNTNVQRNQHRYTYDEAGRILEDIFLTDGVEFDRTTYRYDSKGRLAETTVYRDGKEYSRNVLEKDEAGNLLKQTYYSEGVESIRDEYTYDAKGNMVEAKTYIDGELTSRSLYAYDDTGDGGETMSECWYGSELLYRYIYENHYNDQGVLTERNCYEEVDGQKVLLNKSQLDKNGNEYLWINYIDGKESGRTEMVYNEDGKLLRVTEYFMGEISSLTEYTYENGKLATETCTSYEDAEGNSGVFVDYIKYDANGDVLEESHTANDKLTSRVTYVRDQNGNATLETMETFYEDRVEVECCKNVYNENGKISVSEYYVDDALLNSRHFFYNAKNQVSVQIYYEGDLEIERWENTYDKYGNIIEEVYTSAE